ncbi:MAG: hypothetical protein K2L14_04440 [Duncaniella sp.]|nr:hypothetical protein [Duncaniella sp.]
MKKKIVISLIVLVVAVLALGTLISVQSSEFQDGVKFSDDMKVHSAYYPVNGGMITVSPDVRMGFDSASPVSTITRSDLEKLKAAGMDVDSVSTIYIGFDSERQIAFRNRIYQLSIPAPAFEVDPTRSNCTAFSVDYTTPARIENVRFLLSDDGLSRLGMDFIERFAVEYSWATGMIILHDSVPEGFQKFCDIQSEISPVDVVLSPAPQYFLGMEVDGRSNDFLIDTSLSRITINVPVDDGVRARVSYPDPYRFRGDYVDASREPDQLVLIGGRAKYQDIHRSPAVDKGEGYFCNPLNMFVNDVVLDFPGKVFYIRRGSRMLHNPGFGLPAE